MSYFSDEIKIKYFNAQLISLALPDWQRKIHLFSSIIKPIIMKSSLLGAYVYTGTRVGIQYEIMLLMTGSSGLCFRKAAYQQFVAKGECICSPW